MPKTEEELEFISVGPEDDSESMNTNFAAPSTSESLYDNVIGSWIFKQSKHPIALLFNLLFKGLALFCYIFGSWFTSSFIVTFVLCIIFSSFDFWTVKNISGRLLVGLRWWSYVREDGSNEWIFESLEDMAEISPLDSRIFWTSLYVTPIIWLVLLIIGVLRLQFEYLPVICAALFMQTANLMGYLRCSSSAKNKVKSFMEEGVGNKALSALGNSAVRSWVVSSLLGAVDNGKESKV